MATPVTMPRQGQSVETCIFGQWYKNIGDEIKEGDLLFSYETDKASFEEESKFEGILLATFYEEGDEVPVLVNVAVIGNKGESVEEFRPGQAKKETTTENISTEEKIPEKEETKAVPAESNGRIKISPLARKMAQSAKLELSVLKGTGPNGRIIARDVEATIKDQATIKKEIVTEATTGEDFEIKPVTNMRKLIAKAMYNSLQNSAQLTHHMSADVRKLLELREKVKAAMKKRELRVNVTLNSMISMCVIRALKKHPDVNSHFLGETIKTFKKVHLGMAVETKNGLMVPTVKNADDLSLLELTTKMEELRKSCITRNIDPDLLLSNSASFSISNLEGFGVEMFTPVINLPQVAILGINTIIHRPVEVSKGVIGFVPYIGLSLTYDHRAIDGGPATMFLASIKKEIENFDQKLK